MIDGSCNINNSTGRDMKFVSWALSKKFNIIPIKPNSKKPAVDWKIYQTTPFPTEFGWGGRRYTINTWHGNFAVISGNISGGIVPVDFEHLALYDFFHDVETLGIRTPNGGFHLYFRSNKIPGIIRNYRGYPIDIQGEGSYVLIPPSKIGSAAYTVMRDADVLSVPDVLAFLDSRLPKEETHACGSDGFTQKIDITAVIERYVTPMRRQKGYWQGLCPFHPDNQPSFTVYKSRWYCFGCGAHGDVIDFVRRKENLDFAGAVRKLTELTGVECKLEPKPLTGEEPAKLTPKNIAEKIASSMRLVTDLATNRIYLYRNGVYEPYGEETVKKTAMDILGERSRKYQIEDILYHVRIITGRRMEDFDPDPNILNVRNGLLDLRTKELKPHTPDYISRIQLPISYDPNAKCPAIRKFLSEVVYPEDQAILLEWAGYTLFRRYPFHRALMLVGSGRNGKGTFLRLLQAMLGKENTTSVPLQDFGQNRFSLASLYGKLANLCGDLSSQALHDTGAFKKLTGEDSIHAEEKFGKQFDFYNYAKLIYSANALPYTSDDTDAYHSRWDIIQFPNSFIGREDTALDSKLQTPTELSGFLNLALESLHNILERGGFSKATPIEEKRREYMRLSDSVAAFCEDCLKPATEMAVVKSDLFSLYNIYCKETRLFAVDKSRFFKRLLGTFRIDEERPRINEQRIQIWVGICYNAESKIRDGKNIAVFALGQGGQSGQGRSFFSQTNHTLLFYLTTLDDNEQGKRHGERDRHYILLKLGERVDHPDQNDRKNPDPRIPSNSHPPIGKIVRCWELREFITKRYTEDPKRPPSWLAKDAALYFQLNSEQESACLAYAKRLIEGNGLRQNKIQEGND